MTKAKSTTSSAQRPTRYLVLVLGMHRSGTSALTGVLHYMGCSLPKKLMAASDRNPKGYFEGAAFYQFNIDLLKSAESSWDDWRPIKPSWQSSPMSEAMLSEARDILHQEFEQSPLVVLKDPRICRMVPFWTEAANLEGFQVLPVLAYRNPLEVAKSLQNRNNIEIAEGMLIWLRHVLDAEYATRGTTRFVSSYEQLLADWTTQVTQMQKVFGISFPHFDEATSQTIEDFLQPALRHHIDQPEKVFDNEALPNWILDTFEVLESWLVKEETNDGYAVLDRVRAELDAATPAFSQLIGPSSVVARSIRHRAAKIKRLQGQHNHDVKAMEGQKVKIKNLNNELETLVSNLGEANERLDAIQNSKSWRLTRPIRAFVGVVRGHR